MTEGENLTIAILREIRDEIRSTNTRIDLLGERVESHGEILDRMGG